MQKIVITNAEWLSAKGELKTGNIGLENDRISGFNVKLNRDDKEIDAAGTLILPGAIDPHVHFREPGQVYKEGIENGSRAALSGGVTTVLDMPNNKPACSTPARVQHKKELFRKKSHVNWGIQLHTTSKMYPEILSEIKSAKVYMAQSSALKAVNSQPLLEKILSVYPTVAFHAEDESEFIKTEKLHHKKRPRKSVTRALEKIESALKKIDKKQKPRVVICHMNTADEVEWIAKMKSEGFDVWGEGSPNYLFLTQDDYIKRGSIYQVNPAIRTKDDQRALRNGLKSGVIDFVGTDHAPHSMEEKQSNKPPSGVASIEWLLPQLLMLREVEDISWKRLNEMICAKAAEAFNIKGRDGIKMGNYADLVFVKKENDNNAGIITKPGFNPFEECKSSWQVKKVFVNGILKFDSGSVVRPEIGLEI